MLILLSLGGKFFGHDKRVYRWVISFTFFAALYDLCASLPSGVISALHLNGVLDFVRANLPLASLGLGWVCPAVLGLVIGLAVHFIGKKKTQAV